MSRYCVLTFLLSSLLIVQVSTQINGPTPNPSRPSSSSSRSTVWDELIGRIIINVVELLRGSLIEAGADHISMPDLDWTLSAGVINAQFHMKENVLSGLTKFQVNNITTHVYQLQVDLDVELPLLEWTGVFKVGGSAVCIPLSGGGPFSLSFTRFRIAGGGQVRNPLTSITLKIYDPYVAFSGINLNFVGIYGGLNEVEFLFVIIAILVIYSLIFGLTIWYSKKLWNKLRRKKSAV